MPVSERVVFSSAVESLFSRLPPNVVDADLKAKARQLGFDLDKPLQAAYPFAEWIRMVALTAQHAFPGDDVRNAHRHLGQRFIQGYVETTIGKAVFAFLRLIGPKRTLARTAKAFRSGNNFSESRLQELDPHRFELWLNEPDSEPGFIAGILEAGLTQSGASNVTVNVAGIDTTGITFRVGWA